MNDPEFAQWLERSQRRPLTPEEETQLQIWLTAHPEARARWDEEVSLDHYLRQIPDVPVASNFTARVLQEVERTDRSRSSPFAWPRWLSRRSLSWAGAGAVGALACFALVRVLQPGSGLTDEAAFMKSMAALPAPEALRDFEAIRELASVPPVAWVDTELLAALD